MYKPPHGIVSPSYQHLILTGGLEEIGNVKLRANKKRAEIVRDKTFGTKGTSIDSDKSKPQQIIYHNEAPKFYRSPFYYAQAKSANAFGLYDIDPSSQNKKKGKTSVTPRSSQTALKTPTNVQLESSNKNADKSLVPKTGVDTISTKTTPGSKPIGLRKKKSMIPINHGPTISKSRYRPNGKRSATGKLSGKSPARSAVNKSPRKPGVKRASTTTTTGRQKSDNSKTMPSVYQEKLTEKDIRKIKGPVIPYAPTWNSYSNQVPRPTVHPTFETGGMYTMQRSLYSGWIKYTRTPLPSASKGAFRVTREVQVEPGSMPPQLCKALTPAKKKLTVVPSRPTSGHTHTNSPNGKCLSLEDKVFREHSCPTGSGTEDKGIRKEISCKSNDTPQDGLSTLRCPKDDWLGRLLQKSSQEREQGQKPCNDDGNNAENDESDKKPDFKPIKKNPRSRRFDLNNSDERRRQAFENSMAGIWVDEGSKVHVNTGQEVLESCMKKLYTDFPGPSIIRTKSLMKAWTTAKNNWTECHTLKTTSANKLQK